MHFSRAYTQGIIPLCNFKIVIEAFEMLNTLLHRTDDSSFNFF
jgi:hypothetical protein